MLTFFFPMSISIISLVFLFFMKNEESVVIFFNLSSMKESNFEMVLLMDSFSLTFSSMVGMISTFVLIYTNFYLNEEKMKMSFILTMFLFIVSMIILVFSTDLFWLMVGWDGLGLTSFCLIFFFKNWKSFNSAMVTFISNRMGDFFIISCMVYMMMDLGSSTDKIPFWLSPILCVGAFSKSSQVPFSAWLPLAMAAPTPVSSLVHSSTLVTAGIFILIRFFSILNEPSLMLIYIVGFLSVILACLSSMEEYDMKKIIALSTLSHIGLMMMFIGISSTISAKIHLIIHAFFKSLLFMISGLIIHSSMNSQDIRLIGLSNKNLFLSMSFLLSLLSMMGAPFMAGFYSKEILLDQIFKMESMMMIIPFSFFFSVSATCSYSIRMVMFLFSSPLPSSPSLGDMLFPMKTFIVISCVSCFFSGLMIFAIIQKENIYCMTMFSTEKKMWLMASMMLGVLIGISSKFFHVLPFWLIKICHSMMMIGSSNLIFQKPIFLISSSLFYKMDIKGLMDLLFFFLKKMNSNSMKIMKLIFIMNPLFFISTVLMFMMTIMFFL